MVDFCSMTDLEKLLLEVDCLTLEEARFFMAEIVLALEALHANNVLYRDFKPSNILIDVEGHVKLADFGLSKQNLKKNEVTFSFCGSPIYSSPELAAKMGSSHASDIYGLGLILYELLHGMAPFLE